MDSFANRLMLARAHAGHISIREAADLCDLGRGAWTNWEKGARPADILDIADVIAEKLGVDRDWLLFGGQLPRAEPRTSGKRVIDWKPVKSERMTPTNGHRSRGREVSQTARPSGRGDSTRPITPRRTSRLPRPDAA